MTSCSYLSKSVRDLLLFSWRAGLSLSSPAELLRSVTKSSSLEGVCIRVNETVSVSQTGTSYAFSSFIFSGEKNPLVSEVKL